METWVPGGPRSGKANNHGRVGADVNTASIVSLALGGAVGILLLVAGSLFLNDYAVEATVVEKSCIPASGPFHSGGQAGGVTVSTKLFGIHYTVQDVDAVACGAIQPGMFVQYHIRTGRTVVYDRDGGACRYDSTGALC